MQCYFELAFSSPLGNIPNVHRHKVTKIEYLHLSFSLIYSTSEMQKNLESNYANYANRWLHALHVVVLEK